MRAFEIQGSFGLDSLRLIDRIDPEPRPGEVVLSLRAASLNYRDLLVIRGHYNPRFRLPLVPVSDGVGEVVATGEGVSRVKLGDRVASAFLPGWIEGEPTPSRASSALGGPADGMLAERVCLSQDALVRVPEHLTDAEAATLPCAAVTAWSALVTHGTLKAGDVVLIQGTGGVSIFALQFAKLLGARTIITSSSDEKLERARALGADETINYRTTPGWDRLALDLTGGEGVDHVVEVGGAGTMPRSLKAVRMAGRVSLIGVLSGRGEFDPVPALMKGVCIQGIFVGSRSEFESMNRAIALHQLRPIVDRVFPFKAAVEALTFLETGQHFGKVAIQF